MSDGVANEPFIGMAGIGARTMAAAASSPAAFAAQRAGQR